MEAFIQNHEYNIIRKEMMQITKLLKYNSDEMVVEAVKDRVQETIEGIFIDLPGEERDLLQMRHLTDENEVNAYLTTLEPYVYGMDQVTEGQIKKLFRKEKKLRLPAEGLMAQRHTYLGWRDEGKKRLYVVYKEGESLKGMACQVNSVAARNTTMCTLCGHMSDNEDVVSATVQCKVQGPDQYHAIGFNICSDARACNARVTSTERLKNLLKKAEGKK